MYRFHINWSTTYAKLKLISLLLRKIQSLKVKDVKKLTREIQKLLYKKIENTKR